MRGAPDARHYIPRPSRHRLGEPRAGAALVRNQTELRVTASPRILDIASLGNNAMPKLFDHVGETLGASFVETDVENADLNRVPHCPAGRKARTPLVRHILRGLEAAAAAENRLLKSGAVPGPLSAYVPMHRAHHCDPRHHRVVPA